MTLIREEIVARSALEQVRAKGPVRGRIALLGPAFVAAVAYIDPGNFATNIAGGAKYGFLLVWVIVAANLMAMLVQYLSAKVGIATGKNLPELCRAHLPRRATWGLWVQAEIIAIATDLAEFVGAAIALNLLFGVPPFAAGLITAAIAFGILALQQRGYRRFELAIAAFLGIVCLGFLYDLSQVDVDTGALAGGLVPGFDGTDSVMLAVGILGATVMPHVVYLHGALVQWRIVAARRRRAALAAALPAPRRGDRDGARGRDQPDDARGRRIAVPRDRQHGDRHDRGRARRASSGCSAAGAALAFAVALLASGLSSSSVGTYAGQVVMQGFIDRRIPLFLRRLVTMAPALIVLAIGVDATDALVVSQVVLSFGIPFALVPMILLTRRRGRDGRVRQPARDDDRRLDRGGDDHRAERVPAPADVLRVGLRDGRPSPPSRPGRGRRGTRRRAGRGVRARGGRTSRSDGIPRTPVAAERSTA